MQNDAGTTVPGAVRFRDTIVRPRFGLKVLLGVMLAISMVCAWLGYLHRRHLIEQAAVEEIRAAGGFVDVRQVRGRPTRVEIISSSDPTRAVRALEDLGALESLRISDTHLTTHHAKGIARCTSLSRVSLDSRGDRKTVGIGRDALVELTALHALRHLSLVGARRIGDSETSLLTRFPNLESLCLGGTSVTDHGLVEICRMPRLRHLSLGGLSITDEGLAPLAALSDLEHLSFAGTRITDSGLDHIRPLRGLKSLNLCETDVSGAGLRRLVELQSLEWLCIARTNVTEAELLSTVPQFSRLKDIGVGPGQLSGPALRRIEGIFPRIDIQHY